MSLRKWRCFVWSAVQALPDPKLDLADWIAEARGVVQTTLDESGITPVKRLSDVIRKPSNCPSVPAEAVVNASGAVKSGLVIDTVHQVKGQTLDGIMLVASPKSRTRKSSVYAWLEGMQSGAIGEEQRIVYVALTRPSKLLVVALPESAWEDCSGAFVGFRQIKAGQIDSLAGLCRRCGRQCS
jgi:hypothetical protein